jgi:hypothetical protein
MHLELFALYAGPDQIMAVTSGLAGVLGVLLMFWNKVVAGFFRILRFLRRPGQSAPTNSAETQRSANES